VASIESAWPKYPDYWIDVLPCQATGQVWQGDMLLAESDRCLLVKEFKHVDRLYFPEDDVRWELFEPTESHTVCPFKGEADYWSLVGTDRSEPDVVWTYRTPFPEVADIAGHVCFYDDRLRVTVAERWPDGSVVHTGFPVWGDESELLRLVDVQRVDERTFVAPAYGYSTRNVVEAGQLMAASVVAAAKAVPEKRVTSASMVFARAASFAAPIDFDTEVVRGGRAFSTVEVRARQEGSVRTLGVLLLDAGAPEIVTHDAAMPDVPGPEAASPVDFGVTGRELRAVDAAYDHDPDRVGPPEIYVWTRYRDNPPNAALRSALLAQPTTHWTIAAAMRPHVGVGLADAHVTMSTGVMQATVAFHQDVDLTDWLLYTNAAIWAGQGLTQGEGHVFTRAGRLVASYTVQSMIRPLRIGSGSESGTDEPGTDITAPDPRTYL
jgi:uncharacterized protein (DUF427 family)/acyl-CoA thioesterase